MYANYGRVEDFFFLTRDKNIDVTGKIVIVRYGRLYRGDKVSIEMNQKMKSRLYIQQEYTKSRCIHGELLVSKNVGGYFVCIFVCIF